MFKDFQPNKHHIEGNRNLFGWPELMAFLRVLAGRIPMKKM